MVFFSFSWLRPISPPPPSPLRSLLAFATSTNVHFLLASCDRRCLVTSVLYCTRRIKLCSFAFGGNIIYRAGHFFTFFFNISPPCTVVNRSKKIKYQSTWLTDRKFWQNLQLLLSAPLYPWILKCTLLQSFLWRLIQICSFQPWRHKGALSPVTS